MCGIDIYDFTYLLAIIQIRILKVHLQRKFVDKNYQQLFTKSNARTKVKRFCSLPQFSLTFGRQSWPSFASTIVRDTDHRQRGKGRARERKF